MPRNCPDCREIMQTQTYLNIALDVCQECEGVWFNTGELRRLMVADPSAMLTVEERYVPHIKAYKPPKGVFFCPNCNSLLHVYSYQYDSQIQMDVCDDCGGFWVQEGELRKMQQWHDSHPSLHAAEGYEIALEEAVHAQDKTSHPLHKLTAFFNRGKKKNP